MATYPLHFQFDLYKDQTGFQLQLFNGLVDAGTPGIPEIKVTLPNGGIIRSNIDAVPAFGDGDVTGLFIFQPLEFTVVSINVSTLEEGQFQKPDTNFSLIEEADFTDGIYELYVKFATPSPANTYTSTRYFLVAHQTKALLLEKLRSMYKTYPQIPYAVMYSGTEKRVIRSLMMLEAAEIELSRNNVEAAKELMETVIRFTKTWLIP